MPTVAKTFISKWSSQVKKGTLEYIVLLLLADKDQYGYELLGAIKECTSFEIAEGTIYPLLNRLKREGLIASEWFEKESGVPRKYYTITEQGLDTLKSMRHFWLELSQSIQQMMLRT